MPERYVLTLSTHGLVAWRKADGIREAARFGPANMEGFAQWLGTCRDAEFDLLADVADESFHLETLPSVRAHERRALLARKLRQRFPDASFALARAVAGGKAYVLCALSESPTLKPWLDLLHAQAVPLIGIRTPSLLLPRLLNKAATKAPQLLLATFGSGGLRQSLFRDGDLLFSRLVPIDSPEEGASILNAETLRLQQYLIGQRLLDGNRPVSALCLAEAGHIGMLRRSCADSGLLTFSFDDMRTLAPDARLDMASAVPLADRLLAWQLMQHPPRCRYGNKTTRKHYRLHQWQRALHMGTATALLCALLVVPWAIASIGKSQARESAANFAMAEARHQRETLASTLPSSDIDIETLHAFITQWQRIKKQSPRLPSSLQRVSHALPEALELHRLEWHYNPHDDSIRMDMLMRASAPENLADTEAGINRFGAALRNSPADEIHIDVPGATQHESDDREHAFHVRYLGRPDS